MITGELRGPGLTWNQHREERRMGLDNSVLNKTPPIEELKTGKKNIYIHKNYVLTVMGLDYKGLISIHGVFKLSELVTIFASTGYL